MSVRVRFAPSPTGFLHIGGLRTALYNFMFARHNHGKFILRIEDTDRTRLVENATENLIKALHWAGIEFDEGPNVGGEYGPYIQSERFDLYKKYAAQLIETGSAYYAFDTPEEIDAMRQSQQSEGSAFMYDRNKMKNQFTISKDETQSLINEGVPFVVRLNVDHDSEIRFNDVIRGEVVVQGKEVDDQILLKSDGFPTYHLANVVDDHLMKISHVIRGEEWLPSTPKHVLLYKAFGWEQPLFAHLPLLLNKDKSKLSKRQGSVAVEDFINEGFFKEAIINFVALLGWNPTADRELFELNELTELFELDKVNKAGAVFDRTKLEWMNFQYLRQKPLAGLAGELKKLLIEKGYKEFPLDFLENVINLLKDRIKFLHDITDISSYMFEMPAEYEKEYYEKHWTYDTAGLVRQLLEIYKNLDDFSHQLVHDATLEFLEEKELKLKVIIHPLRLIITGKSAGAGMFETMEVLGKTECINRIEKFLEKNKS